MAGFVNFRTWASLSHGYFLMAQTTDGGPPQFSPICDMQSARDLFAMLMGNPAVAQASLILRNSGGEFEIAAYADSGIAETPGTISGWREALCAACEYQERLESEKEARKAAYCD